MLKKAAVSNYHRIMVSSKTNEWATPQSLYDELNQEFQFTLDPCATKKNHKCDKYYTIQDDGLLKRWEGVVFMNPPYGGNTKAWIQKAYQESLKGAVVVCLIVSATDRSYWHDYIFPYAAQIRFLRGRLKFGDSKTTAPFSSAVIVFSQAKYEKKIVYEKRTINKNIDFKLET